MASGNWFRKIIFFSALAVVLLVFTLKLLFVITRYGITAASIHCEQSIIKENININLTKITHEYIFTVIMYGIVNILQIVEYMLLGKQLYYFLFQQKMENPCIFFKKRLLTKRFCRLLLFFIVLLPYFLLGFAIPALGLYQEFQIEHTEQLGKCYRHYHAYKIFIIYCAINFLHYVLAFAVRVWMIYTVLFIDKLWFPVNRQSECTSTGLYNSLGKTEGQRCTISSEHEIFLQDLIEVSTSSSAESSGSATVTISSPNINNVIPSHEAQNHAVSNPGHELFSTSFLQDWKKVSTDFKQIYEKYHKIGEKVQVYQELFQTWFIVPWIIYLINSSLKIDNVLRPWNVDGDGDTPPSNIPSIYYLLYTINQLITLIVPLLCAKEINTYHHKYFKHMRTEQIKRYMNHSDEPDPSKARCLSFARQLMVDRNDGYDFEPRLVGTSITVSIGNPLFVILPVVVFVLSVSKSLLKAK